MPAATEWSGMIETIAITAREDPRIADYIDIRERDLIGRRGRFIAEGGVVLRMLLAATYCRPLSILVDERRLEGLLPVLAGAPTSTPVYVAPQKVIDSIAGFHLHRGILAVGERISPPDPSVLLAGLPRTALVLVLLGIANHDNMGGAFRNAAAFGVDAVLIDAQCCDPLYRKAIRVSVGASLVTAWARLEIGADVVDLLQEHGFGTLSLSPTGAATLRDVSASARTAILLGAEGPGLDPAILQRTDTVRIPMADGFDSLNVATTCGIVLHHLRSH
jgi:tRNA G18 (ribose-2'-O)-methylase SpoU